MFPETILVTNAVRDLLGHEDRANAGVPVCFYSQNQKKAGSVVEEWQTLRRDLSRQLECPAVRYRHRAPRRVLHPSLDQAINGEGRLPTRKSRLTAHSTCDFIQNEKGTVFPTNGLHGSEVALWCRDHA